MQLNNSNYTLIESEKNGWWYSADIPENKIVVALMTDADMYKKENYNSEFFFKQSLSKTRFTKQRCSGSFLHRIRLYAANSYIMTRTYGTNWIAIGDAAMAFDPLSSQGIYKAIKAGLNAAEAIHEQFTCNKQALEIYSATLNAAFKEYINLRKLYYLKEKRWSQSLFWKRRHVDISM
jgi:flavin-dependent dehydrogenase